jgi:SAM-dependent methyltransferase
MTKTLDLGSGPFPKNPFGAVEVFGVDIRTSENPAIRAADLAIERIPFDDEQFDYLSAFDFIEHIPRVVYIPHRRACFVELINEIYRVLKPGGVWLSSTPAYPKAQVFRDPTHVNYITEETFPYYFDNHHRLAEMYGFRGAFKIEQQYWHQNGINLDTIMRKVSVTP